MSKGWISVPRTSSVDWIAIDQNLCEAYGWTPAQIDAMTLPEIRVALRGKSGAGGVNQALAHIKMKEQLTVEEKLLAMRMANC